MCAQVAIFQQAPHRERSDPPSKHSASSVSRMQVLQATLGAYQLPMRRHAHQSLTAHECAGCALVASSSAV